MSDAELSPLSLAAVTVGALMAARRFDDLLAEAEALLAAGGSAAADLREAAYVASLFCGFPSGVAALHALTDLAPGGAGPRHHRDVPPGGRDRLRTGGEALFRRIHRANAGRQLAMLEAAHPDFAETVLVEAYGRVLARGFLTLPVCELVAVACLAVLDLPPQLRAHLLAARNCGATADEVRGALRVAAAISGADLGPALAMADEIASRSPLPGSA